MRPVNPVTSKTFHRGDVASDGRIYWGYKRGHARWATDADHFERLTKARRHANRFQSGNLRTPKSVANGLLQGARERAKASGGRVTITVAWIMERLNTCALTDMAFVIPCHGKPEARAPSLDRIDSANADYSPENTRLVLWQVNAALNRFSDAESLPVIEALSRGLKRAVQSEHSQSK